MCATHFNAFKKAGRNTEPYEKPFDRRLKELKAYKDRYGHVDVNRKGELWGDSKAQSLFNWTNDLRKGAFKVNGEQKDQLDDLGFDWNMSDKARMKQNAETFTTKIDECEQQLEQLKNKEETVVTMPQLPSVNINDIASVALEIAAGIASNNTDENDSDQGEVTVPV